MRIDEGSWSIRPRHRLRIGWLLVWLLVLSSCTGDRPSERGQTPSPQTTSSPTDSAPPRYGWSRIDTEATPTARTDYSLAADDRGLYLFGGRASGKPLADLWFFDLQATSWRQIDAPGPAARFGHNSGIVEGRLLIFGGQAGSRFFDDLWSFNPSAGTWTEVPSQTRPARRYGAGGTVLEGALFVSHGFTFEGRFDDIWAFDGAWDDVSPPPQDRPVERCLHRITTVGDGQILMFGGQTTGNPFLGDTWVFDPQAQTWAQIEGDGPSARNLFGFTTAAGTAYLFGGRSADGPLNDLWQFDGSRWIQIETEGPTPAARSGIEAAVAGNSIFVFGGEGADAELDDLWKLELP